MRYYLIAGEASGDLHGSNLIRGLLAEDPDAQIRFWGGDAMREAGGELVHHYKDGAVMGIGDVLAKAGTLLGNVKACKRDILSWQPDAVILIDYPGFNMKIARFCHSRGLKVFYYIAPKTWASREGRNRKLRRYVDKLLIVFPFEVDYFTKHRVPFEYVGNPLLDSVDNHVFTRPVEGPYVALLAGSRKGEIKRMMPVCMQVADALGCKVVVAGAPARDSSDYQPFIAGRSNVELVFGRTLDVLKFADAAIINSGTASLEACLTATPQVVCWSTTPFTAFLARKVLRVLDNVKFISLGNLCIDRCAFKELIQEDFTADNVLRELSPLLSNGPERERMLADYADIRKSLGGRGASRKAARAIIDNLK